MILYEDYLKKMMPTLSPVDQYSHSYNIIPTYLVVSLLIMLKPPYFRSQQINITDSNTLACQNTLHTHRIDLSKTRNRQF